MKSNVSFTYFLVASALGIFACQGVCGVSDEYSIRKKNVASRRDAAKESMEDERFWTRALSMSMTKTFASKVTDSSEIDTTEADCTIPPPFNNKKLKQFSVVMNTDTGEFMELLFLGMLLQGQTIGVVTERIVANMNNTYQAELIQQEASKGVEAIITIDGNASTLCEAINETMAMGIPVISFDLDTPCNERHVTVRQRDFELAYLSLEQAAKDEGCCVNVGYGTDLDFAPLINRNKVWEVEKEVHNWTQVFTVGGAASYSQANLTTVFEEELRNSSDVSFIFAAWDFIAISAVDAIRSIGSSTTVYGVDCSTQDIQYMTDPGSPWVATACAVPRMEGAALVRIAALQVADQLDLGHHGNEVLIPVSLILQSFLRENNVQNTTDLVLQMPELQLLDFMFACWIPPIDIYQGNLTSDAASYDTQVVADETKTNSSQCTIPPPFNNKKLKQFSVVMYTYTGEFMEYMYLGMYLQAQQIGSVTEKYVANTDDTLMAEYIRDVAANGTDAIITVHGNATILCPAIVEAIALGIPVISFDLGMQCAEEHVLIRQRDMQLAYLSLEQAAKDVGCCVDVGYGTDLRLQPLRNRNEVWDVEKESNDWTQLFAVNEADSYTKEELTEVFEKELENAPNISFIFAAWDFIAISAVDAIRNTNSPAKLYGIDITTEDIHYMTDPGSPWVATACTVPRMDGAATLRVAALKLAGQLDMEPASEVLIPVSLVLQSFLRENNVRNTTDLLVQMPELQLLDFMSACWIPPIDIYQVTFS